MSNTDYSTIFDGTLGQTLEIQSSGAALTNGLCEGTSLRYEEAADLSDDEIWNKLQAGEL
jgi:hypothetical protein